MKSRVDGTPEWPPRPGELWISAGEWPTYGFDGLADLEILQDDVFLVIKASSVWGSLHDQSSKYVDLQVLFRGQTLTITSECRDGVYDMHKLEEKDDIP